eukprot:Sdes_comp19262_c0_seq1m10250
MEESDLPLVESPKSTTDSSEGDGPTFEIVDKSFEKETSYPVPHESPKKPHIHQPGFDIPLPAEPRLETPRSPNRAVYLASLNSPAKKSPSPQSEHRVVETHENKTAHLPDPSHHHLETAEELPDDMEMIIDEEGKHDRDSLGLVHSHSVAPAPYHHPNPQLFDSSYPQKTFDYSNNSSPTNPICFRPDTFQPTGAEHRPDFSAPLRHVENPSLPPHMTMTPATYLPPNSDPYYDARNNHPNDSYGSPIHFHPYEMGLNSYVETDEDENPKYLPYRVRPKTLTIYSGTKKVFWSQSKYPCIEDIPNHFSRPEDVISLPPIRPSLKNRCLDRNTHLALDESRVSMMSQLCNILRVEEYSTRCILKKIRLDLLNVKNFQSQNDQSGSPTNTSSKIHEIVEILDKNMKNTTTFLKKMVKTRDSLHRIAELRPFATSLVEKYSASYASNKDSCEHPVPV